MNQFPLSQVLWLGDWKNICRNIFQKQYNLDYLRLRKLQTLWNIRTVNHNYFKMALYLFIIKIFSHWNCLVVLLLLSASTLHPNNCQGLNGSGPTTLHDVSSGPATSAKAYVCTNSHLVPCHRFPVGFLQGMSSFCINFSKLHSAEQAWSSEGITSLPEISNSSPIKEYDLPSACHSVLHHMSDSVSASPFSFMSLGRAVMPEGQCIFLHICTAPKVKKVFDWCFVYFSKKESLRSLNSNRKYSIKNYWSFVQNKKNY